MDKTKLNPRENLLNVLLSYLGGQTFSQTFSSFIVGGPAKLKKLIEAGKIRCEKRKNIQNSKWDCNAYDVLLHCKAIRDQDDKTRKLADALKKTMLNFDKNEKV